VPVGGGLRGHPGRMRQSRELHLRQLPGLLHADPAMRCRRLLVPAVHRFQQCRALPVRWLQQRDGSPQLRQRLRLSWPDLQCGRSADRRRLAFANTKLPYSASFSTAEPTSPRHSTRRRPTLERPLSPSRERATSHDAHHLSGLLGHHLSRFVTPMAASSRTSLSSFCRSPLPFGSACGESAG